MIDRMLGSGAWTVVVVNFNFFFRGGENIAHKK